MSHDVGGLSLDKVRVKCIPLLVESLLESQTQSLSQVRGEFITFSELSKIHLKGFCHAKLKIDMLKSYITTHKSKWKLFLGKGKARKKGKTQNFS